MIFLRSFNVVIVEDLIEHQNILQSVIKAMKKPKINPILKSDGLSAHSYIQSAYDIHLFIIDIKLPGLSGDELLRDIRTTERYMDTPIIILTSSSSAADKKRCEDFNVNNYIVKPINLNVDTLKPLQECILKYYNVWYKYG